MPRFKNVKILIQTLVILSILSFVIIFNYYLQRGLKLASVEIKFKVLVNKDFAYALWREHMKKAIEAASDCYAKYDIKLVAEKFALVEGTQIRFHSEKNSNITSKNKYTFLKQGIAFDGCDVILIMTTPHSVHAWANCLGMAEIGGNEILVMSGFSPTSFRRLVFVIVHEMGHILECEHTLGNELSVMRSAYYTGNLNYFTFDKKNALIILKNKFRFKKR